jgi:multiple sugar transport system permease protein
MSLEQVLITGPGQVGRRPRRARRHPPLHGSDLSWAVAFLLPYAAVFAGFVIYPMAYGLWMGSDPALYTALFADPRYVRAALNTVVFVALAANLQMFLALLLSGFFARRRRWIKALLIVYLLPWTLPAAPAFLSFHWMLAADRQGLIDRLLWVLLGIEGPIWLTQGWVALAWDIAADIWKWMPLWTLIFLGGRLAIPQDLYEAAAVDGASSYRRFIHVTLPLLANLYLVSTLIAAIWTFGDYAPVLFVSGGTPAFASDVLSTLELRYALDFASPRLGVAAGLTALPLLIPIVILLMRRLQQKAVQV